MATGTGGSSSVVYTNAATAPSPDYQVTATLNQITANGRKGIAVRVVDADNFYVLRQTSTSGQQLALQRILAGAVTDLWTATNVIGDGVSQAWELHCTGPYLTVVLNGVVQATVLDTTFPLAGAAGIYSRADTVDGALTGYRVQAFVLKSPG